MRRFHARLTRVFGLSGKHRRVREQKNGAPRAPSPLPEFVLRYFFAGAAALAGAAPAFAAGAAGVAGGICAGVAALPFAFISAK